MATGSLIDCHNHIYAEEFDADRDAVIENARKAGVSGMITVSEFSSDAEKILQLAKNYPGFVHFGLGVHPVQKTGEEERSACKEDLEGMLPWLHQHADEMVGLDFTPHYCRGGADDKEHQKEVFIEQMKLADDFNLPLNVHSRSAGRPVVKLLKENNVRAALLHAFDGRVSVALEAVQAGYYLSIPPCVVRSEQKQKISASVPLDRILLETDCPALGPEKMARNNPENVILSLEYLSKARNVGVEELKKLLHENALRLFTKLTA